MRAGNTFNYPRGLIHRISHVSHPVPVEAGGWWPTQALLWLEWGYSTVCFEWDAHSSQTIPSPRTKLLLIPRRLTRFHASGQSHFVTFSCYHRHGLLTSNESGRIVESALERVRRSYGLYVYGYVVMPEHVHLFLSKPQRDTLADAVKSLKQGVSRRLIGDCEHFWHKRYYDFNIRNYRQFV